MKTVNDFLYDADSPEDGLYHFDQETMQAFLRQYRDECELCPYCDGDGYTSEHDPSDPHENGCTNCPIQVQCDHCEATGILFKPSDMKADPVDAIVMPPETLDLVVFLCQTWVDIDDWCIKNFTAENAGSYPMVQGTANQNRLRKIAAKGYDSKNVAKAVKHVIEEVA